METSFLISIDGKQVTFEDSLEEAKKYAEQFTSTPSQPKLRIESAGVPPSLATLAESWEYDYDEKTWVHGYPPQT